jgi:transposase-like protein
MTNRNSKRYSPEVKARAVRLLKESVADYSSEWAAMTSIAEKIGCSGETLRTWVRQAERDSGTRAGQTSEDKTRIKELERENRELKRANEILRKASAFFAQAELDRPLKKW